MGLLDGKVAIITGAGGGLGEAYAKLFAREASYSMAPPARVPCFTSEPSGQRPLIEPSSKPCRHCLLPNHRAVSAS